jgi:hypothetical protein
MEHLLAEVARDYPHAAEDQDADDHENWDSLQ